MSDFWDMLHNFLLVVALLVAGVFVFRAVNKSKTTPELEYIRDDAARSCFAWFRGHPNSLTRIYCDEVEWSGVKNIKTVP